MKRKCLKRSYSNIPYAAEISLKVPFIETMAADMETADDMYSTKEPCSTCGKKPMKEVDEFSYRFSRKSGYQCYSCYYKDRPVRYLLHKVSNIPVNVSYYRQKISFYMQRTLFNKKLACADISIHFMYRKQQKIFHVFGNILWNFSMHEKTREK